jgi:hypothetical protein
MLIARDHTYIRMREASAHEVVHNRFGLLVIMEETYDRFGHSDSLEVLLLQDADEQTNLCIQIANSTNVEIWVILT